MLLISILYCFPELLDTTTIERRTIYFDRGVDPWSPEVSDRIKRALAGTQMIVIGKLKYLDDTGKQRY